MGLLRCLGLPIPGKPRAAVQGSEVFLPSEPTVTVLMPVYNDERFVAEALTSILNQQGVDFDLVIIDDAGTDRSREILSTFSDARITLIHHAANRGLAASLNHGLLHCRGRYIARQDADDVSEPFRLRKQVAYLEQNSQIAYSGTGIQIIDEDGHRGKTYLYPVDSAEIRNCFLNFYSTLPHSSLMFRREALLAVGGYDEMFAKAEDFDLHLRLLERFDAGSIREPLVRIRMTQNSMQNSDRSGECLKYSLFAYAKHRVERRYGALNYSARRKLLDEVDSWFQQSALGGCWRAAMSRRLALGSIRRGRISTGLAGLSRAIAEDPKWVFNYLMHGRRHLLSPAKRAELEALADGFLGSAEFAAKQPVAAK